MAKKISSSDLFEQEDLFKGVRDSATKTLAVFNELQAELKATAQGLKNELTANTQASTAQLKQFTAVSEEANKLMKQSVEIEKLKAQADQQRIKAETELVKLQKAQAQEAARLSKEQEKAAKNAQNEASAYSKLSKQLNEARKAYKDLAVTNQTNTQEAKDLLNTITKLDKQLKEVDATVGQHQRNVGNYEGATRNLKLELRQLVRELQNMETTDPRFQEMTQRAGELKDQIQDTQAVVKATAGSAMENLAGSMANAGQIGVAAFQGVEASMALFGVESEEVQKTLMRLTALMNLSQSLETLGAIGDKLTEVRAGFTAFGSKATAAFNGMSKAGKAFAVTGIGLIITAVGFAINEFSKWNDTLDDNARKQRLLADIEKEAIQNIANELSAADRLQKQLDNENISRSEKTRLVKEFQAEYPNLLSNIDAEKASIGEINTALTQNIELLKLQSKAKAIQAKRAELYAQQLEIELGKEQAAEAARKTREENTYFGINFGAAYADVADATISSTEKKIQKALTLVDDFDASIQKQIDALQKRGAVVKQEDDKDNKRIKKTKENTKELIDLQNKIKDEQIKQIADDEERELAQIDERLRRDKIETENTYAIKSQKEKLITELEETAELERQKVREKYAQEEQDLRDKLNKERTENLTLETKNAQEALNGLKKEAKGTLSWMESWALAMQTERDKLLEKEKENFKKSQEWAKEATDFFTKQSEKKLAKIDEEISAAEKQGEIYRELAANGNINAEQSLAEQERIIAESNQRKEREMKRQQRMELANTIYQTYAGHAAQDPKTALANTIRDASLLQAFISTLPMFYDGTEDTGAGGGVDGKGGFHAVLHPHERVIPKSLNDQIGSLTNEQLTRLATDYQNGRLIGKDTAHSSLELAIMVNELRELKDVIKHKPETNIQLGEITQSAMEIVQSTKQGNTTVYNRFKVRK